MSADELKTVTAELERREAEKWENEARAKAVAAGQAADTAKAAKDAWENVKTAVAGAVAAAGAGRETRHAAEQAATAAETAADEAKQKAKAAIEALNEPANFTVADAVRHYHSQLDAIHKMWSYIAAFGVAACTVLWTKDAPTETMISFVLAGFASYAFLNGWAVYSYQVSLKKTEHEIAAHINSCARPGHDFGPLLIATLGTNSPVRVAFLHFLVDFVIVGVIVARYWR